MLYDSVLERVERNDGDPAVGPEAADRRLEKALELSELVVDCDAKRLERASGWVDASFAATDNILDQAAELGGRAKGGLLTAPDDGACDGTGPAFLAVVAQDPHQLLPLRLLEQIGCGWTTPPHTHVEGAVSGKAEATLGTVELERGATEIGEHRRRSTEPESPENQRQSVEGLLNELHTVGESLESFAGPGEGLRITIESDQLELRLRPQQSLGVSPETDGRVDQQPWSGGHEKLHDPIGEHRQVIGGHS